MGVKTSLSHAWTYQPDPVDIFGSFAPNNTSNPVVASNKGDRGGGVWTVTRTGVGLFLVTFADTLFDFLYADANLWKPAAANQNAEVVGYNPTTATVNAIAPATMQIRVVTTSTGAALETGPTANVFVNFHVRAFQNNNK